MDGWINKNAAFKICMFACVANCVCSGQSHLSVNCFHQASSPFSEFPVCAQYVHPEWWKTDILQGVCMCIVGSDILCQINYVTLLSKVNGWEGGEMCPVVNRRWRLVDGKVLKGFYLVFAVLMAHLYLAHWLTQSTSVQWELSIVLLVSKRNWIDAPFLTVVSFST